MYSFYTEDGKLVTDATGYTGNDVYIWTYWKTGEYDYNDNGGSTFMDYRNNLADQNLIVYGHHFSVWNDETRTKAFTPLEQLLEQENYQKNRYVTLVLENEIRKYEIACVYEFDATKEEVIEAAKLVNAHDFIMSFKDGYDTDVGEGGSRLSTGQKQLISFARAVLADPSIFVLDEATASIDTETEQIIQYAVENIMKDKTSFVVAHRLSTIVHADRILVIRKGQIVEDGNHEELMKLGGYYYRLYTNQFEEQEDRNIR